MLNTRCISYAVFCAALLCSSISAAALPLVFKPVLDIGNLRTGDKRSYQLEIENAISTSVQVNDITYRDAYLYSSMVVQATMPNATISSGEKTILSVSITVRHNVPLRGHLQLSVQVGCAMYNQLLFISGNATAADSRYAVTDAKDYDSLYATLQSLTLNHTSLGYKNGREIMFGKADNLRDTVECIYTGRKLRTVGIPPNGEFNTEHTWVQSRGSSVEPNRSDINHLYPTYPRANSIRANYPFGTVAKQLSDAEGGSRLGITATGDTVFEPRAVSRGNIARSIFYYLVRYGNLTGYYTSPYSMDATLRQWNTQDPPDSRERTRCDTIAAYQGKRNPFVDMPEFVERLNFLGAAPKQTPHLLPKTVVFDPDESILLDCEAYNPSTTQRQVTSVSISHPQYLRVLDIATDSTLDGRGNRRFSITLSATKTAPISQMTCAMNFSDGSADTIHFTSCSVLDVAQSIEPHRTVSIVPHPVMNKAQIESMLPYDEFRSATLHSMNGMQVADLSSSAAQTESGFALQLDATGLATGVYALHLRTSTTQRTQMIVIVHD